MAGVMSSSDDDSLVDSGERSSVRFGTSYRLERVIDFLPRSRSGEGPGSSLIPSTVPGDLEGEAPSFPATREPSRGLTAEAMLLIPALKLC